MIQKRSLILLAAGAAAVLVAAVLLSGGDEDEGAEQASSSAVPTAPGSPEASAPDAAKQDDDAGSGEAAKKTSAASAPEAASESDGEPTREETIKKLKGVPLSQRQRFAQTAALGVLRGYGFVSATVRLARKGTLVKVFVPPPEACAVAAAKVPEVKKRLFEVILFARKVRLNVLGAGDLGRYVAGNCKDLEPPTAPGKLLWSASGTGIKSSEQLQVSANRFTVSYANNSNALEIYVTRGEQLIEPVIKSQSRETGRQVYSGPGVFRVTVTGPSWAVKVFDGA